MTEQVLELAKDRIDLGYDLVALTNVGVPQHCSWVLGPGGLGEHPHPWDIQRRPHLHSGRLQTKRLYHGSHSIIDIYHITKLKLQ